jgi:carbon storage regulator
MLVLSRKQSETIIIGDDIEMTVVEIRGDKVRIGIEAPKTVPVHRREVYDAIHGTSTSQRKEFDRENHENRGDGPNGSEDPGG